ncbi:MAG: DUF1194 domain-containing protein [Alphaproteobacteria bacterium]|nr:DUF1194 domain-containing protein [Alphaproteobacteria bacterium]
MGIHPWTTGAAVARTIGRALRSQAASGVIAGVTRSAFLRVLALVAVVLAAVPARAGEAVDLELVLAVDVSGSIDREEARLQREGYVAALVDPEVLQAIRGGPLGRIAVTYFEWAGYRHRRLLVEWQVIHDRASAERFAARLAAAPVGTGVSTSISGAIEFALPLFGAAGQAGERRVIDISGDGPNNDGPNVEAAREAALAMGVTINGLPILNDRPNVAAFPNLDDLDDYYAGCVIGGPGAFMVVADGFDSFAAAIRRKLILEIAAVPPPALRIVPAAARRDAPAVRAAYAGGCDVGERQLRDYFRRRGVD